MHCTGGVPASGPGGCLVVGGVPASGPGEGGLLSRGVPASGLRGVPASGSGGRGGCIPTCNGADPLPPWTE